MRLSGSVRRLTAAALAVVVFIVVSATAASAHVTVSPDEAVAGEYTTLILMVPHGCGDEPTNELSVKLPETLQSVTPQAVPGWTTQHTTAPLDEPYELHGSTVSEYVDTITWTTEDQALASDQYMTFGINAKIPDDTGQTLLLPAVQRCTDGSETAWIDPDSDSEYPAPAVAVTAAGSEDQSADDNGGTSWALVAVVAAVVSAAATGLVLGGYTAVNRR